MATPSLAMIPSGYKATKLYSVLPTDGTGDFDSSRASSATRVNSEGLIETVASNIPRLNYPLIDGIVKGCPHHILEPQRTNYIINSQSISLSPIKNGTFTDNFAISPDGTLNATKLTATDIDPFFYQSVSFAASTYTASIYVKGIGNSIGKEFRFVIGGSSSNPKLKIPSEWTRFEYTVSMASGSANTGLEITDPAVVGDEVLVWGWQVENGSYPTSYIPTNGFAVTRTAETANGSGNSEVFSDSQGVLFANIAALADDGTNRFVSVNSGSQTNRVAIYFDTSNNLNGQLRVGGSTQASITDSSSNILNFNKVAFKYKQNDVSFYVNGFEIGVDNSANVFADGTLNSLNYDVGGGTLDFYGKTKEIAYYDEVLTDEELEYMTSYRSWEEMVNELNLNIIHNE